MMNVAELMTPFPVTVGIDATVGRCAMLMNHHGFRHLPVIQGDGKLAGMVLDAEVHRFGAVFSNEWVPYDLKDDWRRAADLMVTPDVIARETDDLANLLRSMQRTGQDFVAVVDDNEHPIGVLSEHDMLKVALDVVADSLTVDQVTGDDLVTMEGEVSGATGLAAMRKRKIRHLVLTEDGRFLGVVSWRDLVAEDVDRQPDVTLQGAMRAAQAVTVKPGTTLLECASTMLERHIGCLPVIDKGRPVRIVTRRDVIDLAATGLESEDLFGD